MPPIINVASPGKRRNRARRTIAEILRQLMLKGRFDDEAKDMAAQIVFSLRDIAETVDTSCEAWEKRDYYVKADRFRQQWEWVMLAAESLRQLLLEERWERLPEELAGLVPHFSDVRIVRLTRSARDWKGSYQLLKREVERTHVH